MEHLKTHPLLEAIFETFIVSEYFKRFHHIGEILRLYFWRDQTQREIDLLIYNGREGFPIEIKCSHTFTQILSLPSNIGCPYLVTHLSLELLSTAERACTLPVQFQPFLGSNCKKALKYIEVGIDLCRQ